MTDLDGGLPVAAIVDDPNSAEYEHCLKIPVASKEMSKDVIEWGDELVRRKDVKSLIIEKIEQVEGHPVDEKIATEQSKILQELLEELKQ